MLFLELSGTKSFLSNNWISTVTLKNYSFCTIKSFSLFFLESLLLFSWLVKLRVENMPIVVNLIKMLMLLFCSYCLEFSLSSVHLFLNQWIHFMINLSFSDFFNVWSLACSKCLIIVLTSRGSDWNFIVCVTKGLWFESICISLISRVNWLGSRFHCNFGWNKSSLRSSCCVISDISSAHNCGNSRARDSVWWSSVCNS